MKTKTIHAVLGLVLGAAVKAYSEPAAQSGLLVEYFWSQRNKNHAAQKGSEL
jgi:hypothetical protein